MDPISYGVAAKQKQRIEKVIAEPDSTSGVITVPQVIAAGETITVPAGRTAVLPNTTVNGTLVVDGEVFIPSGSSYSGTEINGTIVKQNGNVVANDINVVHKTGDETIAGIKSFSDGLNLQNQNVSPFGGMKNYIINGNFGVWQRGTSFSGLTNGTYSADRWVVYDSVGDINYNVIRNASVFNTGYGATYSFNSGTVQRSIIQFIENVTKFEVGTQVTIAFEAYTTSTPYTVGVGIQGVRGAWASSTSVVSSPITITNTKTKYSVTLSVPDWSSIGLDWAHLEDTKLALKFDFGADTNGKDFIIGNVQLEEGSVATPFETRPYGLELSLCQRYGELIQSSSIQCSSSAFTGTARAHAQYSYKATKRVIPSVSTTSWSALNCATPFIFANTTDQITYTADALTGGNVAFNNTTPIFLDAEL